MTSTKSSRRFSARVSQQSGQTGLFHDISSCFEIGTTTNSRNGDDARLRAAHETIIRVSAQATSRTDCGYQATCEISSVGEELVYVLLLPASALDVVRTI